MTRSPFLLGTWLAVLAVALAPALPAQTRLVWANPFDAGPDDGAWAVAHDSAGNVLTAGYAAIAGAGSDVLLVKYDRTGQLLWSRTWDGPDHLDDSGFQIVVGPSDDIYLAGQTTGASSGLDFLVLRFDAAGTLLWSFRHDGPGGGNDWLQLFHPMAVDALGNAFLTGTTRTPGGQYQITTLQVLASGTLGWVRDTLGPNPASPYSTGYTLHRGASGALYVGAGTTNAAGDRDFTLLCYDAAGTLLWQNQYDSSYGGYDSIYSIALDASENVFMTGISETPGGFESCLMKCDAAGNWLWESRYGGSAGYHYGWILDLDAAGDCYVSGASMSTGGEYDIVTVKVDAAGVQQWAQRYWTPWFAEDWARDIEVGPDGDIYLTGYTWNWFTNANDAVTLRYSPAGALVWSETYNGSGSGEDSGLALTVTADLDVIVAGPSLTAGRGVDALTLHYAQRPAPSLAVAPMPLLAGAPAAFDVLDFEALMPVWLAYSTVGMGSQSVPFLNVTLGLAQPQQAGGALVADAAGGATWNLVIPPNALGLSVWFQAAQYNQVTNLVGTVVQ